MCLLHRTRVSAPRTLTKQNSLRIGLTGKLHVFYFGLMDEYLGQVS